MTRKRSLIGFSLAILVPFLFSGCLFFDSGGSPTDPDDDESDRPDDDGDGDDIALYAPADLQGSPLDEMIYFV